MIAQSNEDIEALLNKHRPALLRCAMGTYGLRIHDAEDVVQDVMYKVYLKWDQYDQNREPICWLMKILKNAVVDHYRRQSCNSNFFQRGLELDRFACQSDADPQWEMVQLEERRIIETCINSMKNPDHANILRLRYFDGMGYNDIAMYLEIGLGTAKSQLSRARTNLRKIMEDKV